MRLVSPLFQAVANVPPDQTPMGPVVRFPS